MITVKCQICGQDIQWQICTAYDGRVCSALCYLELDWRRTLMILGKDYYPRKQDATVR